MSADRPSGRTGLQKNPKTKSPKERELCNRLDNRFKRHESDPLMMFIKKTALKTLLARMRDTS